jgi:putative FmdB family regulatory protein
MPIFEFRCEKCQEQFEELVLGDDQKVICPACGSDKASKLLSACRFRNGDGGGDFGGSLGGGSSSSCSSCSGGNCSSCGS